MLIWTNSARCDLLDIQLYLADKEPKAALRLALRLAHKAELLLSQPRLGRPGLVEGTREWPLVGTPYKLVYQLNEGNVEILRVIHQSRDWP